MAVGSPEASGNRTYFRDRSCNRSVPWYQGARKMNTHQEECICIPGVQEQSPAHPVVRTTSACEQFTNEKCNDYTDELVAGVGHKVDKLGVVSDAQHVHGDLEN